MTFMNCDKIDFQVSCLSSTRGCHLLDERCDFRLCKTMEKVSGE